MTVRIQDPDNEDAWIESDTTAAEVDGLTLMLVGEGDGEWLAAEHPAEVRR